MYPAPQLNRGVLDEVYKRYRSDITAVLIACQDPLTRLAALSPAIRDCPARVLTNLMHLHLQHDLVGIDRNVDYDLIFRNCALLESLNVMIPTSRGPWRLPK